MAGVGHLKRICKDAFSVAGAVQKTRPSELLGGPGADFLRGVAFWMLRATAACTFSSLIWPDGSAPAALASLLLDPPEPQNIGKTGCFAFFLPLAHLYLLSSDSFSSVIFSLFLFSSLL